MPSQFLRYRPRDAGPRQPPDSRSPQVVNQHIRTASRSAGAIPVPAEIADTLPAKLGIRMLHSREYPGDDFAKFSFENIHRLPLRPEKRGQLIEIPERKRPPAAALCCARFKADDPG